MSNPSKKNQDGPATILFVCTGNTCRSPMAEYMLRARLGPTARWPVASAGLCACENASASDAARQVLQETGIDASGHKAHALTGEMVRTARVILVMTSAHESAILRAFPEAKGKVFRLTAYGGVAPAEDVADPFGGPLEAYRRAREQIAAALPDVILRLAESDM